MECVEDDSMREASGVANGSSHASVNDSIGITDHDAANGSGDVVIEWNEMPRDTIIALTECHDITPAPSSTDTNDESPFPHESAPGNDGNNVHSSDDSLVVPHRSSDTKRRFRAARADVPGAIASSSSTIDSTAAVEIDGTTPGAFAVRGSTVVSSEGPEEGFNISEDFSTDSYVHRRESGALPGTVGEEGESEEFERYTIGTVDATSMSPPRIVTAEVVTDGTNMDQSERRRIVQETIQTISDSAVVAEVVRQDNDKSARKYLASSLVFTCILIIFVVVLVVVLKSRASGSTKNSVYAPTPSPTLFVGDSVFRTTEELYQAVDAYRMSSWNNTNQSASFQTSPTALRYGFPISSWNVSLITDFSSMFYPTRFAPDIPWEFNDDLGDWDVSNAETMAEMFKDAYTFQGIGLERWDVGRVKDFSSIFMSSGFNGNISGWDTSCAESMDSTFFAIIDYNGDLSMWNVSRVQSMNSMFAGTGSFEGIGLEHWDVHNVRDFSYMFSTTNVFNGTLAGWDTSSAETMEGMFSFSLIFNENLSSWDVSKVTKMSSMFYAAAVYTGDGIGSWDVSEVTTMDSMFADAVLFNGDVAQWDVSQLTTATSLVSALDVMFVFSLYSLNCLYLSDSVASTLSFLAQVLSIEIYQHGTSRVLRP
jgi:Mycoplasma protein of unknown function, DUF285